MFDMMNTFMCKLKYHNKHSNQESCSGRKISFNSNKGKATISSRHYFPFRSLLISIACYAGTSDYVQAVSLLRSYNTNFRRPIGFNNGKHRHHQLWAALSSSHPLILIHTRCFARLPLRLANGPLHYFITHTLLQYQHWLQFHGILLHSKKQYLLYIQEVRLWFVSVEWCEDVFEFVFSAMLWCHGGGEETFLFGCISFFLILWSTFGSIVICM